MDNNILIIRVNMFLKNKEKEAVRQYIMEQRKTGVIVLPPYCEAIMVPKDVEIKFEGVETDCKSNIKNQILPWNCRSRSKVIEKKRGTSDEN